ncbi:hypothetical protein AAG570_007034 [Ranatra chinensis]|uniref:CCHC-type domain-containing protein n=1 Tax=Ranatra chinensis TaxID=642074 RepID=A0ABD0YVS6_9HEMI
MALKTMTYNPRGLQRQLSEIIDIIVDNRVDVVLLPATHLREAHKPYIPGFTIHRKDRGTTCGGVAILVRNEIRHRQIMVSSSEMEIIGVQVNVGTRPVNFFSIYKPPDTKLDCDVLLDILSEPQVTVVAGDFNAKHTFWNCSGKNTAGTTLYKFIEANRHVHLSVPTEFTHIPDNGNSPSLDLVLTNRGHKIARTRVLISGSSDRLPVYFQVQFPEIIFPEASLQYHLADWKLFRESLNDGTSTAKPALTTDQDIDDAVEKFTSDILSSLRVHKEAAERKGFEEEKVKSRVKQTMEAAGQEERTMAASRRSASGSRNAKGKEESRNNAVARPIDKAMPRKKGKSPDLDGEIVANIPVRNSFELLKNAPEVEITSKKDKIPPIVLNDRLANIRQFLEDTRKVVKDKFRITNRGRTTQILASNVEDFEALKGLFRLRELEFHTFALRSEHMKRFVIHGLAEGFSAEEVEEELKAAPPAVEATINDIKGVGDISLHTFRVEKYRSGDTPPQCFRCQRYGHTSRYCNLKEVCVKCSGNHHTKDCKEGAQVKCANCQKAHVASYRLCETRIAFLEKRSLAPIGQRTSAGPVTQRRQWSAARPVATNYSFSQALGNQQGSDQIGSTLAQGRPAQIRQLFSSRGTVIAAGDFNARHRLWGCQKKNKSGGVQYDFVMDRRATLVAPSNPTCVPCNGGTPSTLDLVPTNSHKCITDMRTVTEGGSDHLPVLFNIWGRAEANVKRPIYNFAQTAWDLFRRSLDLNIPTASPPLDTPSRIEAAVESLTREINEAIRISTPIKRQLPPRVDLPN